ncbi:hypothetical protein AWC24_08885 [Mycolicibacter senuensis]|nr:hypothetical protein AWC24_08885 [Mycolicibacter senuensis]
MDNRGMAPMTRIVLAVVTAAGAGLLGLAAPARAEPGYGQDCILPGVSTCRLVPEGNRPHDVQLWCPGGQGWVNVFTPCRDYYGPYS